MFFEIFIASNKKCNEILLSCSLNGNLIDSWESTVEVKKIKVQVKDTQFYQDQTIDILMQGKSHAHTKIDSEGNILYDVYAKIDKIIFDEVDVTEIFCEGKQCYIHDNNGTSDEFVDEFYGLIGCNGTVKIDFYTPLWQWYLNYV